MSIPSNLTRPADFATPRHMCRRPPGKPDASLSRQRPGQESEAREAVEGAACQIFAARATEADLDRLDQSLLARAFETETARFRAGSSYAEAPRRMRRTLTNSFQIALGRGIAAKLLRLRQSREAALRTSTGRDLVVAKADVVDAELTKLGLHLRTRTRSGPRRVLRDAFEAGHQAGLGFECRPGVTQG